MHEGTLNLQEKLDWLQLIQSENVGPKTFFELIHHFGSAAGAIEQAPEMSRRGGARKAITICPRTKAQNWLERLDTYGGRLVALGEADYPRYLAHLDPPPPLLCIKGHAALAKRPVVSIVGSRNASAIGLKLARKFAHELGREDITICSGLARGIDTAAHQASLESGTIAVLAGGIDHIYPPENAALHDRIGAEGLLITEMMPGTVPQAQNFPRRNRIISGLSLAVIVVEAARRSGSLITARFAGEQGRDVFAVPGSPLDPRASGTNFLLKNGASLALQTEDILASLKPQFERGFDEGGRDDSFAIDIPAAHNGRDKTSLTPPFDEINDRARQRLVSLLSTAPVDVNELMRESGETPANFHLMILELELAGRVVRHSGNQVSLLQGE